ncbi:hypothetical protein T492DRAFT_1103488, partial [Pavlovales sp. CCMP2436]
ERREGERAGTFASARRDVGAAADNLLLGVLGLLAAAIGAAHGLAVLLVAVVHGLALVVERVAQEVEAVRRRVLRVAEAEAGRALHGGRARRARDIGVPHVRVARVLHRAVRLDALHEVVHEPRQTVRLAHGRRAEEGPQREHAVRVAADAELGRAAPPLRRTGAEVVLENEHAEAGRVARRAHRRDRERRRVHHLAPHEAVDQTASDSASSRPLILVTIFLLK